MVNRISRHKTYLALMRFRPDAYPAALWPVRILASSARDVASFVARDVRLHIAGDTAAKRLTPYDRKHGPQPGDVLACRPDDELRWFLINRRDLFEEWEIIGVLSEYVDNTQRNEES